MLRFQKILIWSCWSAVGRNFCIGIDMYSALTYDVIKSYLTRVWDKKIHNGYWTQGLLCDKCCITDMLSQLKEKSEIIHDNLLK